MSTNDLNDQIESLNNKIDMLDMSLKSEREYLKNQLAMLLDYKCDYRFKDISNLVDSIDLIRSSAKEYDELCKQLDELEEKAYKIAL